MESVYACQIDLSKIDTLRFIAPIVTAYSDIPVDHLR